MAKQNTVLVEFFDKQSEPETSPAPAGAPPLKSYLKAAQEAGAELTSEEIAADVYEWLDRSGGREAVPAQLIDQYVMCAARWVQCEMAINEHGVLAAHPTSKAAVASPYVTVAQSYLKQASQIWDMIVKAVRT